MVLGAGHVMQIVTTDRPGLFARVAGALALSNLNIIDAQIYVTGHKALEVLRVVDADDEDNLIVWQRAIATVEDVLANNDDLTPRFEARERSILRRSVQAPRPIEPIRVDFDNDVSADFTVIEVAGPDHPGLLYQVQQRRWSS